MFYRPEPVTTSLGVTSPQGRLVFGVYCRKALHYMPLFVEDIRDHNNVDTRVNALKLWGVNRCIYVIIFSRRYIAGKNILVLYRAPLATKAKS